jgi:hypothetical protein
MDKGSPKVDKIANKGITAPREHKKRREMSTSLWAHLRAISSPSRDTKPVNALCHAVAGPHVAQPTCELNLSRVLPMISIGMFRLAHGDVVPAPVSCESIVGRRVGLEHR